MERLQKIISAAGVASRRKAEELITSGLVQVNGQTVTELGTKADAAKDHIRVDGKLLKFSGHHVYILLNKPKGYVTTLSDPEGRPTIVDLLRGVKQRVYPVGRLDYASEGLLLLTNDGELANALTKAASHVPKTYLVKVSGQPSEAALEQLRAGIELPDRKGLHSRTAPAGIQLVHKAENPWYEVTLIEGRNRQVRAMFEQTGHHVEKLKRVRYGPFTLDVHPGKFRNLLPDEVAQLKAAVQRGGSATAEAAVRPPFQAKEYLAAELQEDAAPGETPAAAVVEKPKLFAKPFPKPPSKFAAAPRKRSDASRTDRPSNGFVRKERVRPGAFRGGDFRKKAPHKTAFHGDRDRVKAPFQSPDGENRPQPVPSASTQPRPVWKKPMDLRPGRPAAGAPRKWTQGSAAPAARPRTFEKSGPRPGQIGARQQSGWSKPRVASRGESASGPKKWSKARPSRSSGPRPLGARTFSGKKFDGKRADSVRPRAARPERPRGEGVRGDFADRSARPGAPTRPFRDTKAPFWQGADKRRRRKPREERDAEPRLAERRTAEPRRAKPGLAERPDRPGVRPKRTAKFKPSRPTKNRR